MVVKVANYLQAMQKIRLANRGLSDREIILLDFVAVEFFRGRSLKVGDLLCRRDIGSQLTLHTAIKRLIKKKFFNLKIDGGDARIKRVALSKAALNHYEKLASIVEVEYLRLEP